MADEKPMMNKSQEIKNFLEGIFPGTKEAIETKHCPSCRKPIGEFRNEVSKKEYLISGLCQKCQDSVFGTE